MNTRTLTTALALCCFVLGAGCGKKPEYPQCKSDKDCRDGEKCHDGKCVQCIDDSDCEEGEACMDGVCAASEGKDDASWKKAGVAAAEVTTPYESCNLDNVFFDFDSAAIRPGSIVSLKKTAECLLKKGPENVVVEGHCDPRGTEEYNMGLGLERANAIKTFLVKYGVPRKEIKVYSKGEEDAAGEDEATWASDRKGVFK